MTADNAKTAQSTNDEARFSDAPRNETLRQIDFSIFRVFGLKLSNSSITDYARHHNRACSESWPQRLTGQSRSLDADCILWHQSKARQLSASVLVETGLLASRLLD